MLSAMPGRGLLQRAAFDPQHTHVGESILPILINKMKFDPAVTRGPRHPYIERYHGLLFYFSIATALLRI